MLRAVHSPSLSSASRICSVPISLLSREAAFIAELSITERTFGVISLGESLVFSPIPRLSVMAALVAAKVIPCDESILKADESESDKSASRRCSLPM